MTKPTFVTRHLGGSTYSGGTLTQRLGYFLTQAEGLFGPRDPSFTILGIELVDSEDVSSQIWYPPSHEDRKHVIVHLSAGALRCEQLALWELAHECVHLIDPSRLEQATVLEEGLAVWFQNKEVGKEFMSENGSYADAERLVLPLMDSLPGAIRRMRQEKGVTLCDITAELLREYCPHLSLSLCRKLVEAF